jgi:hypothetical protein
MWSSDITYVQVEGSTCSAGIYDYDAAKVVSQYFKGNMQRRKHLSLPYLVDLKSIKLTFVVSCQLRQIIWSLALRKPSVQNSYQR